VLVLGISGSPRHGGNSDTLLTAFLDEARELGAETQKIVPASLAIRPCIECRTCERTGFCSIDDDMQQVYGLMRRADVIVAASPIFFYSVSAFLKAVIDRTQCLWARRHLLKLIDPGAPARKGVFLSVGATKGDKLFEGATLTMKYFFDAVGATFTGTLSYRGIEHPGDIEKHPTALSEARALAETVVKPFTARRRVLYLCRQNACRSQMAWGFTRLLAGERIEAASAGDSPAAEVNPDMVAVMAERGIDMGFISPRSITDALKAGNPDVVVSMGCMDACPVIPGAEIIDWGLADPAGKPIAFMREIRNEIERRVTTLVGS
jgi:arsenate reductase (thioredoxin)